MATDRAVYQLCLPGYDDLAGEGKDGVLWMTLTPDEADTILTYAEDLGNAPFHKTELHPEDAGIDYDSNVPGQMDALIARLISEVDGTAKSAHPNT